MGIFKISLRVSVFKMTDKVASLIRHLSKPLPEVRRAAMEISQGRAFQAEHQGDRGPEAGAQLVCLRTCREGRVTRLMSEGREVGKHVIEVPAWDV